MKPLITPIDPLIAASTKYDVTIHCHKEESKHSQPGLHGVYGSEQGTTEAKN